MDRSASSLLSWLLVPLAAYLAISALSLPIRPYTGIVLRGPVIDMVLPDSPASRAGAQPGDLVVGVSEPSPQAARPLAAAEIGRPLTLEVNRGGDLHRLWLVPGPLPSGDRRLVGALLLVASGFVLIGGWVWGERRDPLTRTFFLLCLAFAFLLAPLPHGGGRVGHGVHEGVLAGVTVFLPALFVHFFALFPDQRASGGLRLVVNIGYSAGSVLFAASLVMQLLREAGVPTGSADELLQTAAALWFAAGVGTALALFASAFGRAGSSDARRRLRVAFAGTLLGAGPLAALVVVRNLGPGVALPGERLALLLTLFVPASFAWATVVHQVFDFRVALRIGTVALLVAATGAGLYVAGEWLALAWWPHLGGGVAGAALAMLAIGACVAGPLTPWLRGLGSRMVPESGFAPLASWAARERGLRDLPIARVLEDACAAVTRYLRLDGCALVSFDEQTELLIGGTLPPEALSRLVTVAPDLRALAAEPAGVRALDEAALAPAAREALDLAGVRWLLPVGEGPLRAVALLGRRLAGSWLGRSEILELERFAGHLAITLENEALKREAIGRVHLDRELREAGAIQAHLLPRRAPVHPTLDCAAAALSCESVGGDYYDFVEGPGRDFTIAVGDAAGKGVPAALVLAGVQARFRAEAKRGLSPGRVLAALNLELAQLDQPEKFVGLLCARVDVRAGCFHFSNAGLTPPLRYRRDGRFEELSASGLLLGVRAEATYPECAVDLDAGDVVVIHSDGLTEARRGDDLFGVEGVRRVLEVHGRRRASDILEALLETVRAFADQPLDDVTVVVLRQLTAPARERLPAAGEKRLKWPALAADASG